MQLLPPPSTLQEERFVFSPSVGPWALGAHGIDRDGESEGEDEDDVEVLRRSRRDIPIHLDYREGSSSSKEESSDDETEVEVIEIDDDEEHSTPARKRDALTAGLSESESSMNKKIKKITLWDINSRGSPIEQGASDQNNNQYIEEGTEDFLKMYSDYTTNTCFTRQRELLLTMISSILIHS